MGTEPTPENLRRWAEVEVEYQHHSRHGVALALAAADRIEELEAALRDAGRLTVGDRQWAVVEMRGGSDD